VYGLRPYKTCESGLRRKFFAEVALFSRVVRVTGCGLFFARLTAVQRSKLKLFWELWGGKFVRYIQIHTKLENKAMSEKKTIRIIKKGEKSRPIVKAKASSARETARDMVETVTNWVTEFQQKRRTETTNALRMLSKTPRGSEA
jgi:hypothetical protein